MNTNVQICKCPDLVIRQLHIVTLELPAQSRADKDDDVYPRGFQENFPIKDHLKPAPPRPDLSIPPAA